MPRRAADYLTAEHRPPMTDRYYVVQAQPQRERIAVQELRNQGFKTFFPLVQHAPRVTRGRLELPKPRPMFPKYVFVSFDLERDRWRSINGTRAVTRLMCMDERPSPVPLLAMSRLLAAGELLHEDTAKLPFNVGDPVEFTSGPFNGQRGLVQACETSRVQVLLSLLGGQVPVRCEPLALKYVSA